MHWLVWVALCSALPLHLACNPALPSSFLKGVDVETSQVKADSPQVETEVGPAAALAFPPSMLLPSTPPPPTLPPLPTLPNLLDLFGPQRTTQQSLDERVVASTVQSNLIDNEIEDDIIQPTAANSKPSEAISKNEVADDEQELNYSGNDTNSEEQMLNATKTETPKAVTECKHATVTAITLMPFNEQLVAIDTERMKQQILLLESYTMRKFDSFGDYTQEATKVNGQFAMEFKLSNVSSCTQLRDYATKAVSYSREIERVMFSCHCEPMWIIAKRRSG